MVDDPVKVIGIVVMFQAFQKIILSFLMEIGDQFGHTGIQELHPAQPADVGFDHHGIYPPDPEIQLHHLIDL